MITEKQREKFTKGCRKIKGKLRQRKATQEEKLMTCKLDDKKIGIKEDWKDKLYVFVNANGGHSTVSGHKFEAEQDNVIIKPTYNELEVEVGDKHSFSLVNNRM